jgi:hypothetical protein
MRAFRSEMLHGSDGRKVVACAGLKSSKMSGARIACD